MTTSSESVSYTKDTKIFTTTEKASSISESQEEGTIIETIPVNQEIFTSGDGNFGEGSADEVNVGGKCR